MLVTTVDRSVALLNARHSFFPSSLSLLSFSPPSPPLSSASVCYLPASDIFNSSPLGPFLPPSFVQLALDAISPALQHTPFASLTLDSCLGQGDYISHYVLELTQLNKWECLLVLACMGVAIRLALWGLLLHLRSARR